MAAHQPVDSAGLTTTAWFLVLEFLPAGPVRRLGDLDISELKIDGIDYGTVAHAKSVSKLLRDAARRALTQGRLRPVTRALEILDGLAKKNGLDGERRLCLPSRGPRGFPEGKRHEYDGFAETFREAWPVESTALAFAVLDLDADFMGSNRLLASAFFGIVEPTLDGLERIVASVELASDSKFFETYIGGIWQWIAYRGVDEGSDEWIVCRRRVWRAMEHWSASGGRVDAAGPTRRRRGTDPMTERPGWRAARVLVSAIGDYDVTEAHAEEITAEWTDEAKREMVHGMFSAMEHCPYK